MNSKSKTNQLREWADKLPRPLFSSRVELRQSSIHGQGLHARFDIQAGELLVVDQGTIVHNSIVELVTTSINHQNDLCVDWEYSLLDSSINNGAYANHSCDANMGLVNERTFVAIRDIEAGAEICPDYSTFAADPGWRMECRCGSLKCRKVVSGADHESVTFREAMGQWFSPYLKRYWNI